MHKSQERGFTLIEVLLASAILATVLVAVTALFIMAMKTNASAGSQTSCVSLAQERMEKLKQTDWRALVAGGSIETPMPNFSQYIDTDGNNRPDFVLAWAVTEPSGLSSAIGGTINVRDLDVRCTALRGRFAQTGRPQQYTLRTYHTRGEQ